VSLAYETPQSSDEQFLNHLADAGLLDAQGHQRVKAAMVTSGQPVDTILLELGLIPELRLADAQASYLGLERAYPTDFPDELPPETDLPRAYLSETNLLPLKMTPSTVVIATAKPLDSDSIRGIGFYLNRTPVAKVAAATELTQHIRRLLTAENAAPQAAEDAGAILAQEDDIERLRDVAREAPIIKLLNRVIATGIERNASDIHIEPLEDHVQVRYRIDGALRIADRLPKQSQPGIVSRIKILAKLNIAEQRLPQDGRIKLPFRGREVEFRVSTAPVVYGESVALRILDKQQLQLDFMSLGYQPDDATRLQKISSHPNGIVLVTGPTGSGKTTTLYAALSALNREEVKLFTVEDPVEYRLRGINQIQVKPGIGLDFAAVLRSILRQDPDIIMIGEIRDAETAKIAIQASLTGHLVLSTLHTNSAAASVTRLIDMGLEDYLLASCLRGIVAQRLLRKLCSDCKTETKLTPELAKRHRIRGPVYEAKGCTRCNGTGYRGRTVAYEILEFSSKEQEAVTARMPEAEFHAMAVKSGMTSLFRSALNAVERGDTSLEEVYRVIEAAPDA
jgi:general secretion pathway protein E